MLHLQMGIKKIFTPQADLSGLTNGSEKGLFVDNVIQKTFINVAEDGTEAAAAAVRKYIYFIILLI